MSTTKKHNGTARKRRSSLAAGSALELSMRPYNGRLWVTATRDGYARTHKRIFKENGRTEEDMEGRLCIAEGKDGMWTYLAWAETPEAMAHELSHVVLHTFERCGIDPVQAGGEPFCYMLGQLMRESLPLLPNDTDQQRRAPGNQP